MEEQISVYFGSVAEGLIVLAVAILSGAALMNGYSVLKNHHQRSYQLGRAIDSFAVWLVIGVEILLAGHVIKATFDPDWTTLMIAGAIAVIQLLLNWTISRDLYAAYLSTKR